MPRHPIFGTSLIAIACFLMMVPSLAQQQVVHDAVVAHGTEQKPESAWSVRAYGVRAQQEFVFRIMNRDAARSLRLLAPFASSVKTDARLDGMPILVSVEWTQVDVLQANGVETRHSVGEELSLQPGDSLSLSGTLRREDGLEFTQGAYALIFDKAAAKDYMLWSDGSKWVPTYQARPFLLELLEPKSVAEIRTKRLFDAAELVRKGRSIQALAELNDLIKTDPSDARSANAAGLVALELRRFSEAANHFESATRLGAKVAAVVVVAVLDVDEGLAEVGEAEQQLLLDLLELA